MLPRAEGLIREPQRRRGPPRRRVLPFVLLALLTSTGPLAALSETATAQNPQYPEEGYVIQFDREGANYRQGDKVLITFIADANPRPLEVRVRCETCPDKDRVFRTIAEQEVVFPDEFGSVPRVERQPRWNDTWIVELVENDEVLTARAFNVWLMDAYRFPDETPHTAATLSFAASGFEPGELIQFVLRHRRADGSFQNVFAADVLANMDGYASYFWVIEKERAEGLSCPHRGPTYCQVHEIVVTGPGKDEERVRFRVVPTQIPWIVLQGEGTGLGPAVLARTHNVSVLFDLRYPNNHPVTPYYMESRRNPDGAVKVRVERFDGETSEGEPRTVANLTASHVDGTYWWRTNWSIPRDAPIRLDHRYRFVIEEQKDRFGNVIDEGPLNNFTVQIAFLQPRIVDAPRAVERTDEVKFVVAFRYKDGSPLAPGDNATPMRACFVPDDGIPALCENGGRPAKATYWRDGLWNFTFRYPRHYPDLSGHLFTWEGGLLHGQDRWGNQFQTIVSDSFDVTTAKLRVNLTTVVAGELRTLQRGWDRGDKVAITATIKYPDGTPFNATFNEDHADVVQATLRKVGADGALMGEIPVNLTNRDRRGPQWMGSYQVSREANEAPVGAWEIVFDLKDNVTTPNRNYTKFLRLVNPTEIGVIPTEEPTRKVAIGDTVHYRFRLVYADGASVTANDVGTALEVRVVRTSGRFEGATVSGTLLPTYDPHRDDWRVEWQVPRELFLGTFEFKPSGVDRHGNPVDRDAASREFSTFADSSQRVVLTQPATRVERADSVVVIFDGRDGDLSIAGFPGSKPAIELQRFERETGKWVTEVRNVRDSREGGGDHVGRFNTTIATTLGLYRFFLTGRDPTFNIINGTSEPFSIVPTNVTRALLSAPPERVGKGQHITWVVEREPGDQIISTDVLLDGRSVTSGAANLLGGPAVVSGPVMQTAVDRVNFTWRVPYASDSGAYSFRTEGRDRYQNRIDVVVPPVLADPSVLTGQVVANPERVRARGEPITMLFAITYPNGEYFLAQGDPSVVVVNESGIVDDARVSYNGLVYEAEWEPPLESGLGEYWFEVSGQDVTGNVFPALKSGDFRVDPGVVERDFVAEPKLELARLSQMRLEVPAKADDVFVAFTLAFLSDATTVTNALVNARDPVAVATLEHTVDSATGRYVVSWAPSRTERLGVYVIQFSGLDGHGNEFQGESQPFVVKPTRIEVVNENLKSGEFDVGKTVVIPFTLRYVDGGFQPVDPRNAFVETTILWDDGRASRPLKQRPDVSYDSELGKWTATWEAPEVLPNGAYSIVLQGADEAGNELIAKRMGPYAIETSAVNSLLNLDVPSPGVGFVALALVGVALALGRRRALG